MQILHYRSSNNLSAKSLEKNYNRIRCGTILQKYWEAAIFLQKL